MAAYRNYKVHPFVIDINLRTRRYVPTTTKLICLTHSFINPSVPDLTNNRRMPLDGWDVDSSLQEPVCNGQVHNDDYQLFLSVRSRT
mmetsp:Transcript_51779/g.124998  ORF Transcript_51779/g.124998 Transcript_51779/m.124998 type:complete len:87 (+) Transcript_51779:778-1038(+)